VPSKDAIRKMVNQEVHKKTPSTCWITNLLHAHDMARNSVAAKTVKGYIHEIKVYFTAISNV
jgi:hypothetical protein